MNAHSATQEHEAVMLHEAVDSLVTEANGIYVDATYGRGGHSDAILKRLGQHGKLFAFDCDSDAIAAAKPKYAGESQFELIESCFSKIRSELNSRCPSIEVSGIIADLGVSSPQLDHPERGFSFLREGPLDMRMNRNEGDSAQVWLHNVSEKSLADIIFTLGEERYARRIARAIVTARSASPIETTAQLAGIVSQSVPTNQKHKHPATRTFLAIRMTVNQELEKLEKFLPQCVDLLKTGGRLVIITFHSLEDRLVKRFIRDAAIGAPGPRGVPFRSADFKPTLRAVGKARRPGADEIRMNRRARSAMMRVAERAGVEANA